MYISITGIKHKGFFKTLRFWIFTIPSFSSAQKSSGNLFCEAKKIGDYHHTLTAWKNKDKMLEFLKGKQHSKAMKNFKSIGSGSTHGYESENIPTWNEAIDIWKNNFKKF